MSLLEAFASPGGQLITAALAHFLWQGFVVGAILLVTVYGLRVRSASGRYACSLAALLCMAACPVATVAWLGWNSAGSSTSVTTNEFAPATTVGNESALLPMETWQPYFLATWLCGVGVLASRLLAGLIGVIRLQRSRQPLTSELKVLVERLGQRMQMRALPLVYLSGQVGEALAVGIVRPLVLVPIAWASEMPLDMLEAVIAHELAHLRRRDLLVNFLQRIVETLLFYHPAVWWLSRRLTIERELCADELAVAATSQRLVYVQTLEQVARWRQAEVGPLLAAFLRGGENMRLLQRVRQVLGPTTDQRGQMWPAGVLALALPVGLWAASLTLGGPLSSVASADDDDEKVIVLRLRNDGDKAKRDDDSEEAEERERKETIERKIIRKKDEAGEKAEAKARTKDAPGDARLDELTALVKRLTERVERLQAELNEIRGDRKRATSGDRLRGRSKEGEVREERSEEERADRRRATAEGEREKAESAKQEAVERQLMQRGRRQAESEKAEAIERERAARRKASEADEAAQDKAIRKRETTEKRFTELSELKKLEALKAIGEDQEILVEKVRAAAAKQAAEAKAIGEQAKAKALEDVKRALAEKKELIVEKEKELKKPAPKKSGDDDDQG